MKHISLIDVDRDTLPGEISWWFADEQHVENLASSVESSTDLAYRFGALYVACQWYWERGEPLPLRLLRTLTQVLEVDRFHQPVSVRADDVLDLCDRVTTWWRNNGDARNQADERRRRSASSIPVDLRREVATMVLAHANEGKPIPVMFLNAIAHLLGLVSPSSGRSLPAGRLLRLVGLPQDVDKLALFLRAARLEGEAMVPGTGDARPRFDFDSVDSIIKDRIARGAWVMSERAVSSATGVARSTIRSWRKRTEYRRLAHAKAVWPALHRMAWANWNQPRRRHSAT